MPPVALPIPNPPYVPAAAFENKTILFGIIEAFAVLSKIRVPWVIEVVFRVVPTAAELPINIDPCSTCKLA